MGKIELTKLSLRNFTTISPSAKALLLMKGYTNIPFARQAAELLLYPEKYAQDFDNKDSVFWARTLHFENRYWSIDNLVSNLGIKNILELSSGFSFRGLENAREIGTHYIDTDLPAIIEIKKELIPALKENNHNEGTLELLPLNALDEDQFQEVVNRFPPGEMIIVNEGLLMYLCMEEKEKLCKIINRLLKVRGGYWVTADIYVKSQFDQLTLKTDQLTSDFYRQHKLGENIFTNFEEAKDFFLRMGFEIDKEADVDLSKLSARKYFLKSTSQARFELFQNAPRMQATWRLRVQKE